MDQVAALATVSKQTVFKHFDDKEHPFTEIVTRTVDEAGEAGRFPALGRVSYERGPGRTLTALSEAFRGLADRGLLDTDDLTQAAEHFNWLVMSTPLNRAMFSGRDESLSSTELERFSTSGVRVFIARYGFAHPPHSDVPGSVAG